MAEGGAPFSLDSALTLFRVGLDSVSELERGERSIAAIVARLARAVAQRTETPAQELALGGLAAIAAIGFVAQQTHAFVASNTAAASVGVRADSWDSVFVHEIAASLERNVPAGANVLSSRLYFSSLDVETDGRYHIRQMPTVGVDKA